MIGGLRAPTVEAGATKDQAILCAPRPVSTTTGGRMHKESRARRKLLVFGGAIVALNGVTASPAWADAVTDWNDRTIRATKGFTGATGAGVTLDSNLGSRIEAIEARAVFDAVNSIDHFSPRSYNYDVSGTGSAAAAAAQAAHDVVLAQLPDPTSDPSADTRWTQVRTWVDQQLVGDLTALGVLQSDGGLVAGRAAAVAANLARTLDLAAPVTTYGALLTPTSNPGIGLWRQSNAAAAFVNPVTGAPTGFDATGVVPQGRPGIDLNWRDVKPFSLSTRQKVSLVADVPLPLVVGSPEYVRELEYVRTHGQDVAPASVRSDDQTAQALYYKQDAEIFINEAARIASQARGLTLDQNAKAFALLANAIADARLAAFDSKYEQKFWRPITALNAGDDGAVTNAYAAWHPLAATPSHPSNTAGHSATGAAGFEVLRAIFGDRINPDGSAALLTTLPWLVGTNSGTGIAATRSVTTFSQAQLENGASRLYLGVHFGHDNLQGQLLGLAVADTILARSKDPAAAGLSIRRSHVSLEDLPRTLASRPDLYGVFGGEGGRPAHGD